MEPQASGDARGAERAPSSIRIAHIPNIRSRSVQGTLSVTKVLEATRTSTNLRDLTEQVQDVLARHGRKEVDPSDPDKRSYYDTARDWIPALLPGVDCPDGTPRAGMAHRFHNSRYPFDVDRDLPLERLSVVRDALATWPYTTLLARSISHTALWVVAHGPKADSQEELRHYHGELIALLPDAVRLHVAGGQNDLVRPRYWPWDPEAIMGADVQADLLPPPPPLTESGGAADQHTRKDENALEERERAWSALEHIPLGPDTYSEVWLPIGMALVNADTQFGEQFDGCGLFLDWTARASHPGSTKPGRAPETYRRWSEENAKRPGGSSRRTLGSLYAMAREHGWTPPPPREYAAPGAQGDEVSSHRPPVIVGRDLHRETQDVIDNVVSWNDPPRLFADSDTTAVVEFAAGKVRSISREEVASIMAATSFFFRQGAKGKRSPCYPPSPLVGAVYAAIPRHLPPLHGVKRAPFYFEGQIVSVAEPGYHAGSGYWIEQGEDWDLGLDVAESLRRIEDLLGEFPYAGVADRACAYGMLIGQVLKAAWPSPILDVSKPSSQTGATKLCQTIGSLADGVEPRIMTAATREEETDKRIITQLKGVPQSLLIDNVSDRFSSDIVASGMTSQHIGGRLLGRNENASQLTMSLQIYITGVNGMLSRDMINRALSVRIDAKIEHPEERSGFRYLLPADALIHRRYYFSAALSLVQRWIDAGQPGPPDGFTPLDSFRPWMDAVAGILHMAGISGFNENRQAFRERADESREEESRFVALWHGSGELFLRSPEDLLVFGDASFVLWGVLDSGRARSLGHRLSQLQDRVFTLGEGTYKVLRVHRNSGSKYSLVKVQS